MEANRAGVRAPAAHDFGFDVVALTDHWKFTYVKAIRSGRAPLADATIAFKQPAAPSREEAA